MGSYSGWALKKIHVYELSGLDLILRLLYVRVQQVGLRVDLKVQQKNGKK